MEIRELFYVGSLLGARIFIFSGQLSVVRNFFLAKKEGAEYLVESPDC
jgi:hypothetical protein